MTVRPGAGAAAARLDPEKVVEDGHHEVVVQPAVPVADPERHDREPVGVAATENLDRRMGAPRSKRSPPEAFLALPDQIGADGLLQLEGQAGADGADDGRCAAFFAGYRVLEIAVLGSGDEGDRSPSRDGGHAVGDELAAAPRARPGSADRRQTCAGR